MRLYYEGSHFLIEINYAIQKTKKLKTVMCSPFPSDYFIGFCLDFIVFSAMWLSSLYIELIIPVLIFNFIHSLSSKFAYELTGRFNEGYRCICLFQYQYIDLMSTRYHHLKLQMPGVTVNELNSCKIMGLKNILVCRLEFPRISFIINA